ncbi:MAG: ATP-binding protein [Candidatus Omnitrophota bacterium]
MTLSGDPHLKELTREDLFKRIQDICNAVAVVLNARDLLEISLKKTMDLFGAKRGSIFILNDDGTELILKIAQGMEIAEQEKLVKRLGEDVVGKVAAAKEALFVEDISTDSRFKNYKPKQKYTTPSFICMPLMIKDQLIGVINIADKETGERFSKHELQLLDFLASQMALNYRRIQLYEKFDTLEKESKSLKVELGKSGEVTDRLMKQVILQEKLASIGKLTGGIAHELNNPLDGVLRYVNLSLDHIKDDDVVYSYLLEAKQGLNRMVDIVKSLLACSRQAPPTLQKTHIAHAIEEVIEYIKIELYHKNIIVEKKLDEDLPEIMDYGIERIISNLMRNAIDAIKQDGEITISANVNDGDLCLRVKDSGCGIPSELSDKIFEPFFTTKDIDKGCGLGLTIVSEIVKNYNGKINIHSEENKGTTFLIQLPLKPEHVARNK